MLVAFGLGNTVVPRLWSVSTGQGTAPAGPVGLKIQGPGPLLVNSLLKDRTSARSWWDLKLWFCSLQGTFLLKSSPILGPQWPLLPVLLFISCHFEGTWEENPSNSLCRLGCVTSCSICRLSIFLAWCDECFLSSCADLVTLSRQGSFCASCQLAKQLYFSPFIKKILCNGNLSTDSCDLLLKTQFTSSHTYWKVAQVEGLGAAPSQRGIRECREKGSEKQAMRESIFDILGVLSQSDLIYALCFFSSCLILFTCCSRLFSLWKIWLGIPWWL